MKIDTSTTAGKIAVMQQQDNGAIIYAKHNESGIVFCNTSGKQTEWNWELYDFFIKPETVEEAANEYYNTHLNSTIKDAVIFGAKWQKDQDDA